MQSIDQRISKESWASNNYDIGPTGYDDSPLYQWDKDFRLDDFQQALEDYNVKDKGAFDSNYEFIQEQTENPPDILGVYSLESRGLEGRYSTSW